ncbi:hypothetical protein LUW74_12895 [Actinomadura madurae]|uniref:hypothetical protein n=1 Tax=Actinomadura madurae TaxID=1993 RepID=UPI00202645F1|nr:hypothetical protein [Actinomadura madurae]URN04136.1 hypothetical protein LUW74_12895 [Actinomadura madurae]
MDQADRGGEHRVLGLAGAVEGADESMPPSLITTWLRGDAADTTAGNNTGAIIAAMPTTRPRSSRAGARSP